MILERFAYTPTETQGRLLLDDLTLYTIERPWVPGPNPGGKNFKSCIPDGEYQLELYQRTNGDWSLRLRNEGLGVYRNKADRPRTGGRWDILIHAGNYVEDVVGCIAPGYRRIINANRLMVTTSRSAMEAILEHFTDGETLSVRPVVGTRTKVVF